MIQIETQLELLELPQEWVRLIKFVQKHPFVDLQITFRSGKPTCINKGIENIRLDI